MRIVSLSLYYLCASADNWVCSAADRRRLVDVKETSRETTLCLAAAHALVLLDDGTVVGDPMEKTTLEALDWKLSKGALLSVSESWYQLLDAVI